MNQSIIIIDRRRAGAISGRSKRARLRTVRKRGARLGGQLLFLISRSHLAGTSPALRRHLAEESSGGRAALVLPRSSPRGAGSPLRDRGGGLGGQGRPCVTAEEFSGGRAPLCYHGAVLRGS